jgi:hypothetical protein
MASIINALSSGTGGIVTAGDASGILQLQTANTAAVTIDGSQNVGIGTASPSSKLYLQLASATSYSSGVTGNGLTIYNSSPTTGQYVGVTLQGEPTSGNGGIASIMGVTTSAGNMDLVFSTRGGGSGLTERLRIPADAAGIKFPATQSASSDANTLDDYEEGTWTPAFTFGSGSTGITYSSRAGKYTKIGNMVYAGFTVTLSSKGSSTGQAAINGLPYASSSAQESRMGTSASYYGNFNTAYNILMLMEASSTYSNLRYGTGGTVTDLLDTHFQNGSSMYGVFIYQTP